jgi:CRISPR-associated protein Cmr1
MQRIRVEIEAVTATFLHVEPEGEARWRAAPFRGLARWWFRALVGGSKSVEEVRSEEASLFGTTERQSRVIYRVFPYGASSADNLNAPVNPGSPRSANRKALRPGSRAALEIVPASDKSEDHRAAQQAYGALWTAIHLGGIGQRARRGAGSLRMTNVEGVDGGPSQMEARDVRSYAQDLTNGLGRVRTLLGLSGFRPMAGLGEFPLLHPLSCRIRVVQPARDPAWEDVRRRLMDVRRDARFHRNDRSEYEFGAIGRGQRLSSPLWIRITERAPDGPLVVLTLMKHRAADRLGARWENAEAFMSAPEFGEGEWVNLGGDGRA